MKLTPRRILIIGLILVLSLIPLQVAFAKGAPFKVVITGPGIDGELEITDANVLEAFGFYQFNDLNRIISEPEMGLGEGYTITRYSSEARAWDQVVYYPNPEGGAGYLYFADFYGGSWTSGQDSWFSVPPEGDAAMKQIITEHAAQPAAPAPSMSASPALIAGLVMLGSLMLVVSVAATRRDRKAAPAL